jgi:hypothetical protein
MIKFKNFIQEEIFSEEDIDALIESLEWEDVMELYDENDFVLDEAITASERLKRGQKMRSRKAMLKIARNIKLKRAASKDVLERRSKVSARKVLMKKFLKSRDKGNLSPAEKSAIEARVKVALKIAKNLPQRLMPKVREIERKRLSSKGNK